MTDQHPDEDELIALALGTLPDEQSALLVHLTTCPACRTVYDEISGAVDAVLPAAPTVAAPAGFDAKVLERIEVRRPAPRRSYRIPLLVAAAAAMGVGLGAVATTIADQNPPSSVTASDHGALLVSRGGSTVGTVEPSYVDNHRVVVMQITDGPPDTHYHCRLVLKDGTRHDAGQWWTPSSGRATWITYGAAATIDRVELVNDAGQVWSSADLAD
ncbi:hypothetical protein [Streptomyces sp. NPDC005485]|uniref:anti-sigma factor family protein n=1 Tax=Streptomyces sp. NPDC005485 TaxID=3155591 RepID=UPI0033AF9816